MTKGEDNGTEEDIGDEIFAYTLPLGLRNISKHHETSSTPGIPQGKRCHLKPGELSCSVTGQNEWEGLYTLPSKSMEKSYTLANIFHGLIQNQTNVPHRRDFVSVETDFCLLVYA